MTSQRPSDSVNNIACRFIEIRNHPQRPDKMRGLKAATTVFAKKRKTNYNTVVQQVKDKLATLGVTQVDL